MPLCPLGASSHTPSFYVERYGYKLYRCNQCGHVWVDPIPSTQELAAFYNEGYFKGDTSKHGYKNYEMDKQTILPIFHTYLAQLEAQTEKRELLDIGAATGIFMTCARERGWKVRGLEISEYAAQQAQDRGLDVRIAAFEDVADEYKGIPVVTMWDVVEHFQNPFNIFDVLGKILPTGGLIMFSIPRVDSLFARLMKKYWTLLAPPQHLHYFSDQSITQALTHAGFRIQQKKWQAKVFDLSYLIHFFLGWTGWHWSWLERLTMAPWVRKITFKINPRDVIIILAEKR